MQIEIVIWRDASEESCGWQSPEEIDDDHYLVTSIGFVVKETKDNLTLAMDLGSDGQTNGRGRIPKLMIVSRKVIDYQKESQ